MSEEKYSLKERKLVEGDNLMGVYLGLSEGCEDFYTNTNYLQARNDYLLNFKEKYVFESKQDKEVYLRDILKEKCEHRIPKEDCPICKHGEIAKRYIGKYSRN